MPTPPPGLFPGDFNGPVHWGLPEGGDNPDPTSIFGEPLFFESNGYLFISQRELAPEPLDPVGLLNLEDPAWADLSQTLRRADTEPGPMYEGG